MWAHKLFLLSWLGVIHSQEHTTADWVSAFPPLGGLNLTEAAGIPPLARDRPQMVLFTFTGTVTKKVRDRLTKVFPGDARNPNGCSVGVTLFVEGEGTDPCAVHRLYIRGHEIATSGINHTLAQFSWDSGNWSDYYQAHRDQMRDASYLDKNHVQGLRARSLIMNSAVSFTMMHEQHFQYDSSLIVQEPRQFKDIRSDIWPVVSEVPFQNLNRKNWNLWLIPVNPLCDPPYQACVYLEHCHVKTKSQVLQLLKLNFLAFYDNSRAPFQVNFRRDALDDKDIREGLKLFVEWLARFNDVWMVTNREAIAWMQAPTTMREGSGLSQCGVSRLYKQGCTMSDNDTTSKAPFAQVLKSHISNLWLYQTVVLVGSYIVILKYDQFTQKKKNKNKK